MGRCICVTELGYTEITDVEYLTSKGDPVIEGTTPQEGFCLLHGDGASEWVDRSTFYNRYLPLPSVSDDSVQVDIRRAVSPLVGPILFTAAVRMSNGRLVEKLIDSMELADPIRESIIEELGTHLSFMIDVAKNGFKEMEGE